MPAYGNKNGWKTGKTKINDYWLVYSPKHPHKNAQGKGYVRQARLVMEKHLGRYLKCHELVHHINGIKDDDRIENLVLITHSEHNRHHGKEQEKGRKRNHLGRFI